MCSRSVIPTRTWCSGYAGGSHGSGRRKMVHVQTIPEEPKLCRDLELHAGCKVIRTWLLATVPSHESWQCSGVDLR
jgi:hypothetical protein